MAHCNAKVEKETAIRGVTGKYSQHEINENGERLIHFGILREDKNSTNIEDPGPREISAEMIK